MLSALFAHPTVQTSFLPPVYFIRRLQRPIVHVLIISDWIVPGRIAGHARIARSSGFSPFGVVRSFFLLLFLPSFFPFFSFLVSVGLWDVCVCVCVCVRACNHSEFLAEPALSLKKSETFIVTGFFPPRNLSSGRRPTGGGSEILHRQQA